MKDFQSKEIISNYKNRSATFLITSKKEQTFFSQLQKNSKILTKNNQTALNRKIVVAI